MDVFQTVDYRDPGDDTLRPPRLAETVVGPRGTHPAVTSSFRLTAATSAVPRIYGEILELYRHRMREVGVLAGGTWWLLYAYLLSGVDPLINTASLGRVCFGFLTAPVVAFPVCLAWLVARPNASMRGLRAVEWAYVATTLLPLLVLRYASVSAAMRVPGAEATVGAMAARFATAYCNFPCTAMIVVYGVFIPNTPVRTAVMLGLLAAGVVASDLVAWMPHLPACAAAFADSAFQTGVMLFLSLGTAFYGSFKVGALQREAMAAREQVRQLGQYRLVRSLGAGAMGEVHLAEHRLLKRPCAVKLVRPERAGDAQAVARFEREVQSTAKLMHPNIVEIYDYGRTEDGTFYYVMEYLDGLNLDELVRRHGPMPPGRARHVFAQLCRALREAHCGGLVHRDIKPSNVFVCRRGGVYDVVKLLDFGLVQAVSGEGTDSRLTRDGGIIGTPEYMPPEQADSPLSVDGRSDIYALGGVLHFMLTGRPPFVRDTMMATLIAHRQEAPRPLRDLGCDVSRGLECLLQRCLAKSPAARFDDVAGLASAVEACPESGAWDEERSRCWWQARPGPEVGV